MSDQRKSLVTSGCKVLFFLFVLLYPAWTRTITHHEHIYTTSITHCAWLCRQTLKPGDEGHVLPIIWLGDNRANVRPNILPDCIAFLCIKIAITLAANCHCMISYVNILDLRGGRGRPPPAPTPSTRGKHPQTRTQIVTASPPVLNANLRPWL